MKKEEIETPIKSKFNDLIEVLRYQVRAFKKGILNLWTWKKIIWKDRDWDHRYIFEILKFKLELQAKGIETRNIHTHALQDAQKIKTCARLTNLIKEEFYSCEYLDYAENEISFIPSKSFPDMSELKITEISERYEEYFNKYRSTHRLLLSGKLKAFFPLDSKERIAMNIAHHNHDKAKRILFNLLKENIEKWWD
jgi:hypothetical protein